MDQFITLSQAYNGSLITTAFDSSTEVSVTERTIIGVFFALASGASLLCYLLLLATIAASKELRSSSFFKSIFSLALNDAMAQTAYFAIAFPLTLFGDSSPPSTVNIIVSSITMEIAWFHNTTLLLFQSFNRLLSICYPERYDTVFGGARIWYFIGAAWAAGISIGAATFAPCCHMIYFPDAYRFGYDPSATGATIISYVDLGYSMTNLVLVQVINTVIFVDIRRRHRSMSVATDEDHFQVNRRKRETALFLQLFVTTAATMSAELTFIVIPIVTTSRFGGAFASVVYIAAMSVNGIVFLGFNRTVNEEAKRFLQQAWKRLTYSEIGEQSESSENMMTYGAISVTAV